MVYTKPIRQFGASKMKAGFVAGFVKKPISKGLFYQLIIMFFLFGFTGLSLAQPARALDARSLLDLDKLEGKLKDRQVIVSTGGADAAAQSLVSQIFSITIKLAGAVFMILILIGGFQYLIAAGNEELAEKARRLFLHAVVGLLIVLAAWAIGTWILTILSP